MVAPRALRASDVEVHLQPVGFHHDVVRARLAQLELRLEAPVHHQEQTRVAGAAQRRAHLFHRRVGNGDHRWRAVGLGHAERAMQFAGVEHRLHDVGAAHQLAADVELRDGWPVAEFLDAGADVGVRQHVDGGVVLQQRIEAVGGGGGEAALRRAARSLHEEDDRVIGKEPFDALAGFSIHCSGGKVWRKPDMIRRRGGSRVRVPPP
jgi:hypothetical protein